MFLLIDNFDSFTFNLVQAFQQLGADPLVLRNNDPALLGLARGEKLSRVCISPGPGRPESAGQCLDFLKNLSPSVPVLGVCLGHQTLGHFGGSPVEVGQRIMHGKTSRVFHNDQGLFSGISNPVEVCRYHSLLVRIEEENKLLEITARTEEDEVMGLVFKDRPWMGVQFHPESILTPEGPALLKNFLQLSEPR